MTTTIPDISGLPPPALMTLKTEIDNRLEELKRRHVEEAAALGLTLVDGNAAPKRARRKRAENETDSP